jgi:hypothetical protein
MAGSVSRINKKRTCRHTKSRTASFVDLEVDGTLGEDSNTTRFDLRHNEARVVFRDHARAYRAVDAELDLRCAGMGVWRVNGAAIEESNGWKIYSAKFNLWGR